MNDLKGKNILFICPEFYDYPQEIIRVLKSMGAEVTFFLEIEINLVFRLKKNINPHLLNKHIELYYLDISKKISGVEFDYFFLIRGKYTPVNFISNFKAANTKCLMLYYQWDSLKSISNALTMSSLFHFSYSFDMEDCSKNQVFKYIPNFCVENYSNLLELGTDYKYDILFVGSLTFYRYELLVEFQRFCQLNDIKLFIHAYISFLEYIKERFIRRHKIKYNDVKFNRLKSNEVLKLYQCSNTILDIPDVKQSGYPFRVFEALGAKKKIITTSSNIDKEQFFLESNIYKLDNGFEGIKDFIKNKGEFKNIDIYSTQTWIRKIFQLT